MADTTNREGAGAAAGSDANSLILTATSSFSSTSSSSDLDTESTMSFFPERSITLGSLIGIAGGVRAMADGDLPSLPHSSAVHRGSRTAVGSMTSSQGISFSHASCISESAKVWSLIPCGACIDANNKGACKGFCCSNKDNSCIAPSVTEPLSSSLGHFLIAERNADRETERLSKNATVYINIMYEESQRMQEAAINPLFDLHATAAIVETSGSALATDSRETLSPCGLRMRSQSIAGETGVKPSVCADDATLTMQAATVGGKTSMPGHGEVLPCGTRSLQAKGQKAPANNMCELGCISYVWTRCRF